ncbi:hypothetical protein I5Q34_09100 [Streptomyces sp. AV19]|uniref:hypothetical protein n=1 Tax=Streptomyces sp. AV19 TaxID=2793068 RepID=UPI0018FE7588|nr:hypothetical protein [Streptomyces sp. AV19]MBH1934443.1 hypothetical protein [Streptomyces sp. AV19]MDG4533233.1 hypothetical protein [Streptomyces sp. AV19]
MKSEQQHGGRYRGRLARRLSAVVALALGTALLAAPAASAVGAHPSARTAQHVVAAAGTQDRTRGADAASQDTGDRPVAQVRQADAGQVALAKEKKKKKKGFFKKLGIFLIVLVIVFILIVVAVIWLIVHFVRKGLRRRS